MRIGIDISQIVYGTGVSTYTKNICLSVLKASGKENNFVFFGSSLRRRLELTSFVNLCKKQNPKLKIDAKICFLPPTILEPLFNGVHFLPLEIFTRDLDVFHSSDWTQPSSKAFKVTTIHDLAVLKYPQTFPKKILSTQTRRFKWIKKEVDLIIAVSESTKRDIVDLLNVPEKKIKVIYEGYDSSFALKKKIDVLKMREKYNLKGDYFLSVATLEPRKNLRTTIKAFKSLREKNPNASLVLAGGMGWEDLENMGVDKKTDGVNFLGYVDQKDLSFLYSGSIGFVYPSLYEGFGLPPLEAMACGVPVITSNVSSLPEVVGDAGILIEPEDDRALSKNMEKLLKNKKFREGLIKKGLVQAKKFNWQKAGQETLKVYEEVFKQNKK